MKYVQERITFELEPNKKRDLMDIIPSGKLSKLFQNYVDFVLELSKDNEQKALALVYSTEIDYIEIADKSSSVVKGTLLSHINEIRQIVNLPKCYSTSVAGLKTNLIELKKQIEQMNYQRWRNDYD